MLESRTNRYRPLRSVRPVRVGALFLLIDRTRVFVYLTYVRHKSSALSIKDSYRFVVHET